MGRACLAAVASGAIVLVFAGAALSGDAWRVARPPEAKLGCLAALVERGRVHAGTFTGRLNPGHVVDGRFRLYVLGRQARLTNKMGWFLPRKRATEAPFLSVKGVRLAAPGRAFADQLAEIFYAGKPEDQHVYASNFKPPSAGCWRLTFKTGRLTGSLRVLVRNG